jgi:anhydro-N-acetylmuramic acid kinase
VRLPDAAPPRLIKAINHPIPADLRRELLALCQPGDNEIQRLGAADVALGEVFAAAVAQLLAAARLEAHAIRAIGSHGQTVRHCPEQRFTLQIGDPNIIAQRSGITTVADFRRRDLAVGGQGAPLVPAFHHAVLRDPHHDRVILNIGGMANITILPAAPTRPVTGFDTGPGNVLMDHWVRQHRNQAYDPEGAWAAAGQVNDALLERLLDDAYFAQAPPKSTGRERFNAAWLAAKLAGSEDSLAPQDVQATLCELTARSAAEAIAAHAPGGEEVLVCGGGARNRQLLARLQAGLAPLAVRTTDEAGLPGDWIEAMAFAWLARETLAGRHGNLAAVTGASQGVVLGGIYPGPGPG